MTAMQCQMWESGSGSIDLESRSSHWSSLSLLDSHEVRCPSVNCLGSGLILMGLLM